ncbi:thiamine pyrophosphate-dependent dehydrogenase E1 component subunit alpha [Phenylobacterium montanum]|uniref:Thiamine pyrophosphate-dependent dehydrogenase E1 component subunit alpha n=1 Tax=Phenylobacterium montanum TaxID=2823693 RepID=A0A975G4P5_9CAUL|nr:thiamine pyrophosphate-dependent dehydrogenase E1 component subunit alpha [Caulobacter sp. S6]QUD90401.1 thiamine pyrophosphate-dependent dehydrogenase E1 component subunit alpha [Caulobacter sp. S6]QUD90517.1 thiamine pyrophosphate-dependent dehydrogenase E1 component subunit alpha [Caulobacter sp. S6]
MQLSRDDLKRAYRLMFTIRAFEERVDKEFALGNIPGFAHVYLGQEASGVGVCFDLSDEDWIGSTHRGHGHCIAKGCDVKGMMLEIMGKAGGLCGGKGGSMHIADMSKGMLGANAIVGGSPPIAVGAALTQKVGKTGKVAVAFSGDGASNQGTVFEALNMAVVLQVPAIFVFENNGYGEHTASSYAVGAPSIADRVQSFGLPCEVVDGMDFFAVREAMGRALEHARSGRGPYALESRCKRFLGHFVGDPQAYRTPEELAEARAADALPRFRFGVTEAGLLSQDELDAVEAAVLAEIEDAVQVALAAPFPDPGRDLTRDVYLKYA